MPKYKTKTVAIILGTRPEIIKLAPVIWAMRASKKLKPLVIASGQHKEMAEQAFKVFDISPEIDLSLMQPDQTPNSLLSLLFSNLDAALAETKPVGVVVQGDTTTAMGSAIAAFNRRIPVAHIEAGLRTHNLTSPFPEEMNRTQISHIAQLHFCPTSENAKNLNNEGIIKNIFIVGNTVVDSLIWIQSKLDNHSLPLDPPVEKLMPFITSNGKYILVTGHRRENFDQPLINLCQVLTRITEHLPQIHIIYPVHKNPHILGPVAALLNGHERIHLLPPVNYPSLIYLMKNAELIISDSGGIQEEAPVLGKRLFITRDFTERPEAIQAGVATLTSLNQPENLFHSSIEFLTKHNNKNIPRTSPFGDGAASSRIISTLESTWS